MHPLDIISESPNLYILQKESNKSNFGGVLFLIYLAIAILVIVYYVIDYTQNPPYDIQSFAHFNIKSEEEKAERIKNPLYNPTINFKLNLSENKDGTNLSEKVKIFNPKTGKDINKNEIFSNNINGLTIDIIYELNNLSLTDYLNYIESYKIKKDKNDTSFYLYFSYEGFILDHQNKISPIIKKENNEDIIFYRYYQLDLNATMEISNSWRNIIYTQKKELFGNDTKYGGSYIENSDSFTHEHLRFITYDKKNFYILLSRITFGLNFMQYTEYSRKRISEFDLLANILSLIANIFTGFRFILSFYSNNFNNFKIIEKLLNRQEKKKIKINKYSEMNDLRNKEMFTIIKDDVEEKDTNKISNADIIYKDNNINESINDFNDLEGEKEDEYELNSDYKRIKKLNFFDFFLNNLYCCCKKNKKQNIIHICNQIVYKYASIDILIKNQILMENFLKDYKWNNPDLNNIENNNLFIQLKQDL